jgi:hypothetical protein
VAVALAVFVLVLFAGPLLLFVSQLRAVKVRGMFEYGALAASVGRSFEQKWLTRAGRTDETALEVGDFSATTDLFGVVANVYSMRLAPFSLVSLAVLAASAIVPLVPVWLTIVPVKDVFGLLSKLLF